ncbi:DUF555 domain-containing protein [Halocatena pleomorpha]|uniref:UPF0212 protein EIK79_02115 n=1 Tax=Halocatena pleomorpha TaxID=1785090 RepID=A0A3P3RJR0_9EURY|nr:DUF555 domain-containing protein [Halocatena pleomorpha]RRJ33615.1 DUF555 domain-containing protein [Halocatena pleomorpha]
MDCRVVVEAAIPVYDVGSADEAVRIAISKTGDMLNPDLNYVEISMGTRSCPHCGEEMEPAFVAADEALVALELEMTVFNVEDEEHASRIARKEIGQRMQKVPLDIIDVETIDSDSDSDSDSESESDSGETSAETNKAEETDDEDLLPDFQDLMEEN